MYVGRRYSSDSVLLWLWCRPADTALIPRGLPYAMGVALKGKNKNNKNTHKNPQKTSLPQTETFSFFGLFRAAPPAYGSSQARGQIGAVATSLHHSHSNAGSKLCLQHTPQLMAMLDT